MHAAIFGFLLSHILLTDFCLYSLVRDSNRQGKFLGATFAFIVEWGVNFTLNLIKSHYVKSWGFLGIIKLYTRNSMSLSLVSNFIWSIWSIKRHQILYANNVERQSDFEIFLQIILELIYKIRNLPDCIYVCCLLIYFIILLYYYIIKYTNFIM